MENDDDEELVEAEIPRGRMNTKNSTSREKQEHEDSGHTVLQKVVVLLVSKVVELVDNIELNCWMKRREKE